MKKPIAAAMLALSMSVMPVLAADMGPVLKAAPPPPPQPEPSMFDIAFGGAVMSDYNFRGISQSDRGPAVFGYVEPRVNAAPWLQLYGGIAGTSVKLPTDPTAEIDFYGGIRPTVGPLSFDFGFIYYWYPKERQVFLDGFGRAVYFPTPAAWTLANTDYWEIYGKVSYTFAEVVTFGASVYYSHDWLKTEAPGTFASGTLKVAAPSGMLPSDIGAYVSGELGHYWLGTTGAFFLFTDLPDYTFWNVGVGLTYKALTLDLRYYDTDLSRPECFVLTGDLAGLPGGGGALGQSKWCDSTFIAKLSFDTTLAALK